jgi:RHS repeat-associated protein
MSGNFYETATDLNIPGRGFNLNVTRTYNSLGASTNGPFGYGWSSNLGMSLVEGSSDSTVTITDEQGSQVVFTLTDGAWAAPPRNASTLTSNSDGSWTYSRWDGDSFTFDSSGALLSESDRDGDVTTFTYNGSGHLVAMTDSSGRPLTIAWSGSHISSITDPGGQSVSYTYSSDGALASVENLDGLTTDYTYDSANELLTVTDPDGGVLTNTYDGSGQVTKQVDPMGRVTTFAYAAPQADETTTLVTDPNGDQTLYTYEYGLLVDQTAGYGTPDVGTTTYVHDPVTLGVTTEVDPDGGVTTSSYDDSGNLLSITDPARDTTSYTYNDLNEVLTSTDAKGVTTTNTYDSDGNLLTTSEPLLNAGGTTQATTTTSYTYGNPDNPGLPTKVHDPDGDITTYSYDTYGDTATVTDPSGDETTYTYNVLGQRLTEVSPNGNVGGCGCAARYTTTYTYSPTGQVLSSTNPDGDKVTYTFNGDGYQLTSVQPDGTTTFYTYNLDNEVTEVQVQSDGNVVEDAQTAYDADGNVTSQTNADGDTTTYSYNQLNQQTSSTSPLGATTSNTYDPDGNVLTSTDPGGDVTTNAYNPDGSPIKITYSDGTPTVTYGYDADGRKITMTDGTGTSTWNYNSLGQLTSYTDGAGNEVSYGYDLDGNQTSVTYPDGNTVNRAFNADNETESISDWNSNTTTFGYDPDGALKTENLPNGVTDSYSYDPAGNSTAISDASSSGTVFAATYTVNDEKLITADTSQPAARDQYQYNTLNQLCYAGSTNTAACTDPPSGAATYSYDPAGNMTDNDGATQAYNAGSEVCWTDATASADTCSNAPAEATTYAYNNSGDLTTTTPPSGPATVYSYNQLNELARYQTGTASPTTYAYDGDDHLASETTGTTTRDYTWDPTTSVPTLLEQSTDGQSTIYIYGPLGLPLEEILPNGNTYYYAHDNLGSTRALTTSTGTVANTYSYNPYGVLANQSGTIANDLLYVGQYLDPESGLYYFHARYYNPATGQFLSVDPLVAQTGQPYTYAGADPVNLSDPTGLIDKSITICFGICLGWDDKHGLVVGSGFPSISETVSSSNGASISVGYGTGPQVTDTWGQPATASVGIGKYTSVQVSWEPGDQRRSELRHW